MDKYIIGYENEHPTGLFPYEGKWTTDCEWFSFLGGYKHPKPGIWVIIDTEDHVDDAVDPKGFHCAHLCEDHIELGLLIMKDMGWTART